MKRLIDKLKQQCSISIGGFAITGVVVPAVVLVASIASLLSKGGGDRREVEWAVINGAFIASILGAAIAGIGLWCDEDHEKCDNALIIFVVTFFVWVSVPAMMPTRCG